MNNRVVPPLSPLPPPSLAELLARLIADVQNNTTAAAAAATNRDGVDDEDGMEDSIPPPDAADLPRKRHRLTVIESLLRQEQLPVRQRNTIDVLVREFQHRVGNDIHDMITDQRMSDEMLDDDDMDGTYEGLDNQRDSVEEVETALRIYPGVLARRKDTRWDIGDGVWVVTNDGDYPIQCLPFQIGRKGYVHNRYALSFIHLFAKLAIDFNSFDDTERGGLLIEDPEGDNVFENLALPIPLDHRRDDDVISTEWIRLRQMNLMKKDDIREYNLFMACHRCHQTVIVEPSVRFLVEWDPECLFQIDRQEISPFPLQVAATRSVRYFRFLFDYFIRYFPYKKGISMLFRTNPFGYEERSPFSIACGYSTTPSQQKDVMEVVDAVLARYHSTTPINTIEALMLTATNPTIDLDGVYFLLRRQPEVLLKMMPYSKMVTNTTTSKQDRKRKRSECCRL